MNNNEPIYLSNRFIFNISGKDGFEFLQSIVTAEIKSLYEKKAVATCLLTPQGRILFDFIIYPDKKISEKFSVFIDCQTDEKESLIRRMSMYRLRSEVEIVELPAKGISVSLSITNESFSDPRHGKLPYREIKNRNSMNLYKGKPSQFEKIRKEICIAEGPKEIPRGEALPLDYWMDKTGQVSFEKGCFIGQEVTARVFHRNKIRRRLIIVDLEDKKPDLDNLPFKDFKFVCVSENKALLLAPINFVDKILFGDIEKKIEWSSNNLTFYLYKQ